MAGVFNLQSVAFFRRMNVSRIVLPRELSLEEFAELSGSSGGEIDFEVIAMFQKCEFIDAFCNFYHAVNYRPCVTGNGVVDAAGLPVIATCDRAFEGHGCQLPFRCGAARVKHLKNDDMKMPFCAACMTDFFVSHGICHFKIAGRGYPDDLIIRAITFLRRTVESKPYSPDKIRNDYRQLFGKDCNPEKCYYFSSGPLQKKSVRPVTVKHRHEQGKQHRTPGVCQNTGSRPVESACFLTRNQLIGRRMSGIKDFNRIYFGHETCERLLPVWNDISRLSAFAREQNIPLTFVSPFLSNAGMKRVILLLEQLAAAGNEMEVVTSDWGLLSRLMHRCTGVPVVSRFLVGQQLDFRMKHIHTPYEDRVLNIDGKYYRQEHVLPSAQMLEHLSQCTLLKPETLDFLERHGIRRLELSNVYQTIRLPERDAFRYSLHVPFAPVAIFRNCAEGHDFNGVQPVCSRDECHAGAGLWHISPARTVVCRDNALYYRHACLSEQLKKNPQIDRIVLHGEQVTE
jgi:hypothetical protein